MNEAVDRLKKDGREELDQPPGWLKGKASEIRNGNPERTGSTMTFRGDTYVYCLYIGHRNHGHDYYWFRQLKSDFHETTREEGTCPSCQKYVRRMDGDDYLTCHRCGWEYKPWSERLRNLVGLSVVGNVIYFIQSDRPGHCGILAGYHVIGTYGRQGTYQSPQ